MLIFVKKQDLPNFTRKQIAKEIRFSYSTIERFRKDINMDSLYEKKTTERKKNSQGSSCPVRAGFVVEICELIEEYSDECNKKCIFPF